MTEQEIEKIEKSWPTEAEFSSGKEFKGPSAEEAMRQVWKLTAEVRAYMAAYKREQQICSSYATQLTRMEAIIDYFSSEWVDAMKGVLGDRWEELRQKCADTVRNGAVYDSGQLTLTKAAEKIERL